MFVFGRSTLTGIEFSPSRPSSTTLISSSSSSSSSSSTLTDITLTGLQGLGGNQLWGETQSTTLESVCNKMDLVAGQSSSPSLTATRVNQRPRQLHDVRPHVSLLHTHDLSALDDSSVDDSERASAASTIPMLTTLLSFWLARRSDWPRQRGRKARDFRRGTAHGQLAHFFPSGIESGEHHRQPRRHGSRCTRALMRTLGRSRWLNGLCRCLHSGCTDGTGPRPSIEP